MDIFLSMLAIVARIDAQHGCEQRTEGEVNYRISFQNLNRIKEYR
jgi:hypothetical protein